MPDGNIQNITLLEQDQDNKGYSLGIWKKILDFHKLRLIVKGHEVNTIFGSILHKGLLLARVGVDDA